MMLTTERLVLRPWQEEDAESLYRYACNGQVGPAAGWKPHESVEESRRIIRTVLSQPDTLAVLLRERPEETIGSVGVFPTDAPDAAGEPEIGYWIGRPFWDVYKRYQTFCRNYSGNRLYRIACGSSSADYNWTEVMMKNLDSNNVDAIDLHYYTMPVWPEMESATDFDDELYYKTIAAANFSDELITRHSEIMNRYDPEKKIGLVIGEWGCWHKVEEGTNPGFLYQQNTMRDAIVAAIELNVFNRHSDRVVMANLAQAVNVLQSVILTEGDKMIKTPTYHVFDLFKTHQNNEAVYCYTQNENMSEGKNAPMISVSASVNEKSMTVTVANCSLTEEAAVECSIFGFKASSVSCRILTNEAHSYNDFDCPDRVSITEHTAVIKDNVLKLNIPPCAVVECVVD